MESTNLSSDKIRRLTAFSVFAVSFGLYLKTLCPTVYTMDNAELAVAANTLSIAHPTGYPLFCLLGKLFTLILPFGEVVYRINVMNALFGAMTSVFLFLLLTNITKNKVAAAIASLIFAVSRLYWGMCSSGEVYALNGMLVALNLYLLSEWVAARRRDEDVRSTDRRLLWLAFFCGLGLTNHLTSGFVLPAVAVAVLMCDRGIFLRWRSLVKAVVLFIIPLSLYTYLPLRAQPDSAQIWTNIYGSEGFLNYVTGKMFRPLMFGMTAPMIWNNVLRFLHSVLAQFPIYVAWMLPIGGLALRRKNAPVATAIALVALVDLIYVVNYDIKDIDNYYVPGMLALAVFLGCGLDWLFAKLDEFGFGRVAAVSAAALAVVAIATSNYRIADKSNVPIVKDYADNLLKSIPPKSLVIACGDSVFNALLYDRIVHHNREDLILVERNVIRTWRPYSKTYSAELYLLTASAKAPEIERTYRAGHYTREQIKNEKMLADIIGESIKVRPVYLTCLGNNDTKTHPILDKIDDSYQMVLEGLAFRFLPKDCPVDKRKLALCNERLWSSYRLDRIYDGSLIGDELEREIPERYSVMHVRMGELETDARMYAHAAANFRKALVIDGRLTRARDGLALALVGQGDLPGAMKEWRTAFLLEPKDKVALHNLRIAERQWKRAGDCSVLRE